MICITKTPKSIHCALTLPLSKSIINRLLVISHLSGNEKLPDIQSEASDTEVMIALLQKINFKSNNPGNFTEINVGNAGTVMRFLTAVLAITPGKWIITGTERMQLRPIKPLTDALQGLGADLLFNKSHGYPPVFINGNPRLEGGLVKLYAGISSQFISALMMLGPLLKGGITIELLGDIISGSYIRMTQSLMQTAGAELSSGGNTIIIKEGKYREIDFSKVAEPDWSAAAFWYEMVALAPAAHIMLKGLHKKSVQGDSVLPAIFINLGVSSVFNDEGLLLSKSGLHAVTEFDYDFTECPDLAQAVIVTCAALGIKGRFTGLKTLRVKETDRIEALRNELTKLGYGVDVEGDHILLNGLIVFNNQGKTARVVSCYDDHRMAMSFAPLALKHEKICLDDPEVVKKSYPGFWNDMERIGIVLVK